MTEPTALGDLELAALVSSRICHDVINPVSAISNGLELLGEEPDQAMREAAMDLIRKSVAQASAKLQFARLAFGAAGSAGAEIDLRDAEKVARDFLAGSGKHQVSWQGPAVTLPKNKVKLLLNLVALGAVALPRGGVVNVEIAGTPPDVSFIVKAKGDSARLRYWSISWKISGCSRLSSQRRCASSWNTRWRRAARSSVPSACRTCGPKRSTMRARLRAWRTELGPGIRPAVQGMCLAPTAAILCERSP